MVFLKAHAKSIKVLLIYNLVLILVGCLIYVSVPILLNYLPEVINSDFDIQMSTISYSYQILICLALVIGISDVFLLFLMKNIFKFEKLNKTNEKIKDNKLISLVRNDCYKIPYIIYIIQFPIGMLIIASVLLITGSHDWIMLIKIFLIVLSFDVLATILSFVFAKRTFSTMLLDLPYNAVDRGPKISLAQTILIQLIPMLFISIVFVSLAGYSKIVSEKANIYKETYSTEMQRIFSSNNIEDENDLVLKLNELFLVSDTHNKFIIYPDKTYKSYNGEPISNFIIEYATQISSKYDGQIMDSYGIDLQGTAKLLIDKNGDKWFVGVLYKTSSLDALGFFGIVVLISIIFCVVVLVYVSKNLSNDVEVILLKLKKMSSKKYDFNEENRLKVISHDEIGDLVIAFNKIQDLTQEYIQEIKDNQEVLMESDRLASLGQLIGGIAHNLKTPIMSISGNLQGIQDLITEYNASIGDPEVNNDDHKAIAQDMQDLVDKTKIHLSYMSDIITVVKGQAVHSTEAQIFSPIDVLNRIDILMKHNLKKALVDLHIETEETAKTAYIKGDINGLIQVIDNIIQNAIYAYNGNPNERIDLAIIKEENMIQFRIQDYGVGISESVKDKLFKEMITTRGKNGTGLGLYMSYSMIKGNFKGDMYFESEEGKGTTFFIKVPISE